MTTMGATEKRVRRGRKQWQGVIAHAGSSTPGSGGVIPVGGGRRGGFLHLARTLGGSAPGDASMLVGEPAFIGLGTLVGPMTTCSAWDIELALSSGMVMRLWCG